MDGNGLIALGVVLVLCIGAVVLGVVYYPRLKNEKQGYPLEAQIEEALLPVIYQAICAAFRLQEQCQETLHQRLAGVDKKAFALLAYKWLPDKVGDFDLSLVKAMIGPERFAQLVQDAFDRFDVFWMKNQTGLYQAFQQWQQENGPATANQG